MADSTSAQVPARGWRSVMLAGIFGFAFSLAAFHFVLPVRLWESSAPEFAVSLFLSAVVASFTAVLVTALLSRSLRLENRRMRGAINNMAQGLCMFDGNERLVVCNHRYMQMYSLSADIVTPGSTLHSLLEYRIRNGTFSRDPVAYRRELTEAMTSGNTTSNEVKSKDGRTISVINRPMPGGGWVATHEDITDRRDAERERVSTRVTSTPLPITQKRHALAIALQSVSQVVPHRRPFDVEDRVHDGVAPRTVGQELVAAQHTVELRAQPLDRRPAGKLKKCVRNSTATQPNSSKAWPSISSLVSELTPLRRADATYQVLPISSRRFGPSTFR